MRTGILLPNWIGDVVMATPALRALRKLADREEGELIALMKPYVRQVIAGLDWFDDQIALERRGGARTLREARLDRVVLTTNSFRTAWTAWRAGVPERIGYQNDLRSWMLTHAVPQLREADGALAPPIDGYLNLARAAGAEAEPPTLELATTDEDEQATDEVWHRLGLPPGERVIVLNTGGAFGASKNWPAEHFAELARQLVDETDFEVLVNCGPAERDNARKIVELSDRPGVKGLADWPTADDFCVPIGLSKGIIRRCRLLVSTDSGPRFFGVAFGKPVVSLFGPTGPRATRTHSDRETQLSLELDCSPCMKTECPLKHHRCMTDLSVSQVYQAVRTALDKHPQNGKAA